MAFSMGSDLLNIPGHEHSTISESEVEPPKRVPQEIGGRDGLDPSRFGDWEKNGRCIDF
jgi:hypothetical protein